MSKKLLHELRFSINSFLVEGEGSHEEPLEPKLH